MGQLRPLAWRASSEDLRSIAPERAERPPSRGHSALNRRASSRGLLRARRPCFDPGRACSTRAYERKALGDTRALELALDRARATYQREVVAATFAKLAAEGDHCHARRVDPPEMAQVENDPVYAVFAEALDLRFQDVSRAVVQLACQVQRVGPGTHAGEPQLRST